jgi:hypothetical protein
LDDYHDHSPFLDPMNRQAARFSGWRGPRPADPDGPGGVGVRLLAAPGRPPATPIERLLVDILAARGPLTHAALVSELAQARYRDELAQSGWLAALAFFNESVFVAEVTRVLEGTRDVLWEFDPATVSG